MRRQPAWVIFALCLLSLPAQAGTVIPLNLAQMTRAAETIFVGTVTSWESRLDAQGHPATFYTFRVDIPFKGDLQAGQTFTLKQFGYHRPDLRTGEAFQFYGLPKYRLGARYLLYLTAESAQGFRAPVGLEQAAFRVLADGRAVNPFDNAGLLRNVPRTKLPSSLSRSILGHRSGPLPLLTMLQISSSLAQLPFDVERANALYGKLAPQADLGGRRSDPQAGPLTSEAGEPTPWDIPSAINAFPSLSGIPYNVDGDTTDPVLGALGKVQADQLVADALAVWEAVTTSSIAFSKAADLNTDVTAANFSNFDGQPDGLSPIVYDEDGTLTAAVFGAGNECFVLGFAGPEFFNLSDEVFGAVIVEAIAVLNGIWLDGDNNSDPGEPCAAFGFNVEMSVNDFRGVFVHEFGHYFNLDHTQVNGSHTAAFVGGSGEDVFPGVIGVPPLESTNTMFPFAIGHDANTLEFDDIVSVSTQYPTSEFLSLGTIEGTLFHPDGVTPFNCGNVIVRDASDPFFTAASNVSGALYFSGFGANPTAENGKYHVPGLPSGSYLVHVEAVNPAFTQGSTVGPCDPPVTLPGPAEFYNGASESSDPGVDDPAQTSTVFVSGGTVSGVNIIFNASSGGTNPSAAVFLVDNTGKVRADGAYHSGTGGFHSGSGADLAEGIRALELLRTGEVVELDPEHPGYYRKSRGGAVVGVVSTQPGMTLGHLPPPAKEPAWLPLSLELQSTFQGEPGSGETLELQLPRRDGSILAWVQELLVRQQRPLLALMGRVPVWVTEEGGPIRPGDLLTTSPSRPGYATRCALPCRGPIVGKALEPFEHGEGQIEVLLVR